MRKSNLMNMTEGRPMRLLFVFALPLLIGNLFQQAYNLADSRSRMSVSGRRPVMKADSK